MGKALSEATESPRPEPHKIACVKWQAVEVGDCLHQGERHPSATLNWLYREVCLSWD